MTSPAAATSVAPSVQTKPRPRRGVWLCLVAAGTAVACLVWLAHVPAAERFQKGLRALEVGELERAQRHLALLQRAPENEAFCRVLRAGLALETGRLASALDELAHIEPQGELRRPVLMFAGEASYRLGRLAEAESCFLPLSREFPELPDPHRWLGAIYYDLGAMQPAIEQLEKVIRLDPHDYRPHELIGLIHVDMERFQRAVFPFREALRRNPPDEPRARILIQLGRSLVQMRDYAGALDALQSAAPSAPIHALRAESLWNLGRQVGGQAELQAALADDSNDRTALRLQADIYQDLGDDQAMLPILQNLLNADPHDHKSRYQLAQAYARLGRQAESDAQMARMEHSLALARRSTELYQQVNARPTDPQVRDDLAAVCDELGKFELARMWQRAADALRARQELRQSQASGSTDDIVNVAP